MSIDVRAIRTLLRTAVVGSDIVWHERVTSTNDVLRALLTPETPEGLVVGADEQTAGKGRFQRRWISPAGESLTFSLLLRPPLPEDTIPLLSFAASLAVAKAIAAYPCRQARVRWPNDVFINGRKVCGILAEKTGEAVIVGIGLNVNQREFPEELRSATSLAREADCTVDRGRVLHILLHELDEQYARVKREGFNEILCDWRTLCDLFGAPVTLRHGEERVDGVLVGVDDDGALELRDAQGVHHRYYAGETTHQLFE